MTKAMAELALYGFMAALSVCGLFGNWGGKEEKEEAEAHAVVLESLSDADLVGEVELHTIKNIRDQVTVEEAIELDERRRLLGMGGRRN